MTGWTQFKPNGWSYMLLLAALVFATVGTIRGWWG
jgi:hypothetical protein